MADSGLPSSRACPYIATPMACVWRARTNTQPTAHVFLSRIRCVSYIRSSILFAESLEVKLEVEAVQLHRKILEDFESLLVGVAHSFERLFDPFRPNFTPHLLLHSAIVREANPQVLVLALLINMFVDRVVTAAYDLILAVCHTTATVLEAKGTEVTAASRISAVERVAAIPVRKSHLAPRAVHRQYFVHNVLLGLEHFEPLRLHLLDGGRQFALHFSLRFLGEACLGKAVSHLLVLHKEILIHLGCNEPVIKARRRARMLCSRPGRVRAPDMTLSHVLHGHVVRDGRLHRCNEAFVACEMRIGSFTLHTVAKKRIVFVAYHAATLVV
mmetsp:Transcript_942/g.2776  ORF Transcript_942/g.2776 Transcript_942/m.2776 type:complete len:328 (-) Transcript_942:62-1045(-)